MPFQIRTSDGRILIVDTKVGDGGFTQVAVQEVQLQPAPAMEPSDEEQAS